MGHSSHARFAPTRWSLVRRARQGDAQGRAALAELCGLYWPPVYAFFRRDGMSTSDARDLTQGLFAELLERGDVAGGDPEVGRFRSYLLACARHYRSNQHDRERAQKRGGDRAHLPIVIGEGNEAGGGGADSTLAAIEPATSDTPEQAYLRAWVRESVAATLRDVEQAERAKGHERQFRALRDTLEGDRLSRPYTDIAAELSTSEAAIKVAVHRLRRRFRTALLQRLGATVDDAGQAEAELSELFAALA